MDGFMKRNIKTEVDDLAPKFGMAPNLEYRAARDALDTEQTAISYLRMAPNYRFPAGHKHKQQEEIYLLVSGSAHIKLDDNMLELLPWDVVRIAEETMRNLEAGPDGAELILFGAPRTAAGDAEMHQGWWT